MAALTELSQSREGPGPRTVSTIVGGCGRERAMRIHLVTPKNPPSFWTYDQILPTLGKDCIFPNLSMPTLAGLTPREHDVTLCDENVEPIDFDVEADVVGITGYIVHEKRMREII